MRTGLFVVLGGIVVLGVLFVAYDEQRPYVRFPFSKEGTLTLLTRPVPVLPPHAHESTSTRSDSILSPGHGLIVESDVFVVSEDMWLTGKEIVIEHAPESVLHHLILAKEGGPNEECPSRDEELYTVGADTRSRSVFPEPYGIYLRKGERIYLSGMIHNPEPPQGEGGTYEQVSIGFRWTTELPSLSRSSALSFHRIALQDQPFCQDQEQYPVVDVFTVPARAVPYEKSSDTKDGLNPTRYVFTEPGLALGFTGHLHPSDGGIRLELFMNGKKIGTVTPMQDTLVPWVWKTSYEGMQSYRVVPGDVFTISATYENTRDVPVEDAMGQAIFFFDSDLD